MITKNTFQFLTQLKKNNHREWFQSKQNEYIEAKTEMLNLLSAVNEKLAKQDRRYTTIEVKKCLFRINRDVRFSANKSPYKTNIGASINLYGKKSMNAGFYIHLEPNASFVGGGIYRAPSDILGKVRQEIDYNYPAFLKIINNPKFKRHYGVLDAEDKLVNPPKGYAKDNEAVEYLKYKSFVGFKSFSNEEMMGGEIITKITDALTALLPLINFLNGALDE